MVCKYYNRRMISMLTKGLNHTSRLCSNDDTYTDQRNKIDCKKNQYYATASIGLLNVINVQREHMIRRAQGISGDITLHSTCKLHAYRPLPWSLN